MIKTLNSQQMLKKSDRSSAREVKTSLSLNKTRPLKEKKIQQLQEILMRKKKEDNAKERTEKNAARLKPESKIAMDNTIGRWLIPARVAFFLNGLYFLIFSIISFVGIFSNFTIIRPFFTLSFETSFSSFFLLEIAAMFAFLVSILYFYASKYPRNFSWFYFIVILLVIPYHLVSNLQKMQIELPQDFQNYLYFDTIILAVFWICYLISIYPYISRKIKN
jgi:hypothetical protein